MVPDILMTIGLFTFLPAAILGIFLITDDITAYVLVSIIGAVVISFGICYILLLDVNLKKWQVKFTQSVKAMHDAKVE